MRMPTLGLLGLGLCSLLANPAAGQTLLSHDFDDGTDGPFTPLGPGWEVVGGTYHCRTESFATGSSSLAGDLSWSDYSVSFDMRTAGSVGQLTYLRVADFLDYYQVSLRAAPYNDVQVNRLDYIYEDPHLVPIAAAACPHAAGVWHHVEITVIDYAFDIEIDGQHVLHCVDNAHPQAVRYGGIALVCFAGGAVLWQDVWYDNVEVTAATVGVEGIAWGGIKALFR